MGVFRKTKGLFSTLIDIRADRWMSLDFIKETSNRLAGVLKDVAVPKKSERSETFEQALRRLELTEDDLKARQHEFRRLVAAFLVMAFVVILYGFYLALTDHVFPAVITVALAIFCLTQAFRYHFWLFQIKHRKLGCSIKEWYQDKTTEEQAKEKPHAPAREKD